MQKFFKNIKNNSILRLLCYTILFTLIVLIFTFGIFINKNSSFLSNNVNASFDGSTNYNIATYSDLCTFRNMVNNGTTFFGCTINLTANITMDSATSWTPIGHKSTSRFFAGTFNGNGYNIDGLYIAINTTGRYGLFDGCDNVTIRDLNITNANIVVTDAILGSDTSFVISYLCSSSEYSRFIDCTISGSMNMTIDNSDSHLNLMNGAIFGPVVGTYWSHGNNIIIGCVVQTNDTINLTDFPNLEYNGISYSDDYIYSCVTNSTINITKSSDSDTFYYNNFTNVGHVINCIDNNDVTITTNKNVTVRYIGQNSIFAGSCNVIVSGSGSRILYTQGFNNIILTNFTISGVTYSDYTSNSYFYGLRNGVLIDTLGLGTDSTYKSAGGIEALNWDTSLHWDFDYAWGFVSDGYDITGILPTNWVYPVPLQLVLDFDTFYSNIVDPDFDYSIDTDTELNFFAYLTNCGIDFLWKTINLNSDIDMSAREWVPIAVVSFFSGEFYGNSNIISGLTITNDYINVGFVGSAVYSSFTYFYLTNINYTFSTSVTNYLGGFCARSEFTSIQNIMVQGVINVNDSTWINVGGVIAYQYNGAVYYVTAVLNLTVNASNTNICGLASSNVWYGLFYGDINATSTGSIVVCGTMPNVYDSNYFYGNIYAVSTSTTVWSVKAYALGSQIYSNSCMAIGTITALYNTNVPSTYVGAYSSTYSTYVQYKLTANGSDLTSSGLTDLNVVKNKSTLMSLLNISESNYNNYALLSDGWYCVYLPEGFDFPMIRFCCQRIEYTISVINNYTLEDTVTGDETTYHMGDSCTLNALSTVDKRFTFSKWMVNGVTVSTNTSYTFTVEGDTVVMAVYRYYLSTFTINHISTLFWISEQVNFGYDFDGIQIELAKDLDFSYVTDQVWNTIGDSSHDFKGTFNCGGYSISYDASINAVKSGGTAVQGSNITLFYNGISGKATNFVLIGDISLGVTDSGDFYDKLSNLESGEPLVWEDKIISKPR